jgi:preprotein translocase subunit SecF
MGKIMAINFIKYNKLYLIFSVIFIILAAFSLLIFNLKFSIDFTGGSILELEYQSQRPSNQEIQNELSDLNLGEITVQPTGEKGVILRTKELSPEVHAQILQKLKESQEIKEIRFEAVGPVVGNEVKEKTKKATIFSVIAILFYITVAFRKVSAGPVKSWQYAIAATIALCHDVFIVIGLFALLGRFYFVEISLPIVVALITVFGYSINDTVVIFDRIRENVFKKNFSFEQAVNESLNQTLFRSINTSLTVEFCLLMIFFFGGETLKYFSLALILGVAFGTYSSIFIAPPILVWWNRRKRS